LVRVDEDARKGLGPQTGASDLPEIFIGTAALQEALRLAQLTYERNRERKDYRYPNKLATHQVGKVGEVGVEAWLRANNLDVEPIFRDLAREKECDLKSGRYRVEIKSWSPHSWLEGGRCVAPTQLPWKRKSADVILWTTASHNKDRGTVCIQGWNTPDEVGLFQPRWTHLGGNRVFNHQVPLDRVHVPTTLLTMLESAP
jgi:hypothetical protein